MLFNRHFSKTRDGPGSETESPSAPVTRAGFRTQWESVQYKQDEGDNERYDAAHLFDQLAEGKRSTRADARRKTEVKTAFLQENEMS